MNTSLFSCRLSLVTAGFALALVGVARGGSFSANFDDGQVPSGGAVSGSASVAGSGGVGNSGVLVLTPAAGSQEGSFIINDLDSGARVGAFTATFNLHLGNGTATPADGISFCFGTDVANSPPFNEEGVDSSSHQIAGLVVVFDAYDNGDGYGFDNNGEGPEFRIKFGGSIIARRKITNQFQTGAAYVPVSITYTPAGTLTLVYNNVVVFTNLYVFGPIGTGARFGFGSRTGGLYEEQFVDNLNITTAITTDNGFYVKHPVVPYPPVGLSGAPTFQVSLQDNGWVVDTSSVSMTFNGVPAIPAVSKVGGVSTIAYTPPGAVLPSSVNHVAVNFSASGNPKTLLYDLAAANAPLWSLAPLSRSYLPLDTDASAGATPLYRSVAYNPLLPTNHLYVVSRTGPIAGLTINVLDANTGDDVSQMSTAGIGGGSIILLNIVVADDGYIYAANMVNPYTSANPLNIYRWANDDSATAPVLVFSGDPGAPVATGKRWGDTLAVRGSGADTQLILDSNNSSVSAILAPTDGSRTTFTNAAYSHTYGGTIVGRGLDFGPTNTYFLKKRSTTETPVPPVAQQPLELIRLDTPPGTTLLTSTAGFYGEVGLVDIDWSRNLAAGIMFVTNTAVADHLVVYDISDLANPLQIAQYDFPVTHRMNNNCIGKVAFGADKIFAVDGNNGIIAVPIVPPLPPALTISATGGSVILTWTNTVPGFNLYSTPSVAPSSWNPVFQPVLENGNLNSVTDTPGAGPQFYRLVK